MKTFRKAAGLMIILALFTSSLFGKSKKAKAEKTPQLNVVASTSWAAAFADIAGVDQVESIAPVNLRHPPEYEITVSDVLKIQNADVFIYAGFERMMKTLGDKTGSSETQMVKVTLDNSLATVKASTETIANATGTQKEQAKRFAEYEKVVLAGKAYCEKNGLTEKKVLCNKNQTYLAKELGLNVAGVFGPGALTSEQLLDAKKEGYDIIIDNIHNPVGQALTEVLPDAVYINWRNFPEKVEHNALINVVQANINTLK